MRRLFSRSTATRRIAPPSCVRLLLSAVALCSSAAVQAEGTPAGTIIENTAVVEFDVNGSPESVSSNAVSIAVDERIDVVMTVQTSQVIAAAGDSAPPVLFTLTNTGNGSEAFRLAVDSALSGDDFDPVPATPSIWLDRDASGDLSGADEPYTAGSNDPLLDADQSIGILLMNDIPAAAADGGLGQSQLRATSLTGSGDTGTVFDGAGDTGVAAVLGASGGDAAAVAEYLVEGALLSVDKSVSVADPFGGNSPVPGATLTYSVDIEVTGSAVAANCVFTDPLPANTSYVASTLSLNGVALSDAADADAGEATLAAPAAVTVRLGDLSAADGIQTVSFQVTID